VRDADAATLASRGLLRPAQRVRHADTGRGAHAVTAAGAGADYQPMIISLEAVLKQTGVR
jgi:hypothetical protein